MPHTAPEMVPDAVGDGTILGRSRLDSGRFVSLGLFSETTFVLVADVPNGKARIVGDGSAKIAVTR
jgi:hypothetical protein